MRALATLLIAFLCFTAQAQTTWCPPGAKWVYNYYPPEYPVQTSVIRYSGDTSINGKMCKRLTGIIYGWYGTYSLGEIFTYSSNDTVYFLNDGDFSPTYIFNVSVGDTILYRNVGPMDVLQCDSLLTLVVELASIKVKNGHNLRYYRTRNYSPGNNETPNFQFFDFYERFGAISPDMMPYADCYGLVDVGHYELRCYSDNLFGEYKLSGSSDCDWIPIGVEENNLTEVSIYPNPATNTLYISNLTQPTTITLYSLTGQRVLQEQLDAGHGQTDVSALPGGMYLYSIETGGETFTGRVVKR